MADILLVNPLFLNRDPVESKLMTPYFPLGILYIAAVAREAGFDVAIFDPMFENDMAAWADALKRERPRVVGISVLATVRRSALNLAALAKQQGATVVMGGADPTARFEAYLKHREQDHYVVDVVSLGESETNIVPLLQALLDPNAQSALGAVPGVAYRDENDQIKVNERCMLIKDLDTLPLPARDLVDWEPYRKAWHQHHGQFAMSLIATRGCPFDCAWCQKTVFGRSYRPRGPHKVAEEMLHIKTTYRPDMVRIVDDVMGIDKKWIKSWHDAVLEMDAVMRFECLSRVDLIDAEMLTWLQEAGCQRIAFGAESGSQKVLDAMTKGTTVDQILKAAQLCRNAGIETYFYMMVGYPTETWEDLKRSVQLLRQTRPDHISTTIAYPLPDTAFYERMRKTFALPEEDDTDWDHTAENRLLFARDQYSTFFYRRVIRWFHHEWQAARFSAERTSLRQRLKLYLALTRDRLVVNVLAHLPGLGNHATGLGNVSDAK